MLGSVCGDWQRGDLVREERVAIQAPDGPLTGSFYTLWDAGAPVPGVLLGTGLGASRTQVHWLARWLSTFDLAVLTFDLAGHGDSPGLAGARSASDMRAALRFLAAHPAVRPDALLVGGQCLSGSLAVQLAPEWEGVRGVFALGIVPEQRVLRPYFWEYMLRSVTDPEIPWPHGFDASELHALLATMDVRKAAAGLRCPLLIVSYSEDRMCPPDVIRQVYERAPVAKRLAIIDGGFHSAAYHDLQVASVMQDWIDALRTRGSLPQPPRRSRLHLLTAAAG